MKQYLLIIAFVMATTLVAQDMKKTIIGKITDGRSSIENVSVTVASKSTQTFSDNNGRYSIEAVVGDKITYSYQGLKNVVIKVEDVTRVLNITMVPDVEELDEVTIVGSNRKTQQQLELEYPSNQNIIRTAYGFLNAETAPGNIRFLNEDQINSVAICILDLLRNEFAGIRVQGSCLGAFGPGAGGAAQLSNLAGGNSNQAGVIGLSADANGSQSSLINGKVFIRGTSSLFNPRSAIFDVDGQIFTDPPIWIDVKNIKRLAILNNFATSTQYGSAGAGGVIVVNTVNGLPQNNVIYDRARLRNNFVSNNILSQEDLKRNFPTYLKEFESSTSFEESKSTYEKYAPIYGGSPYFFIDAQDHFSSKWNENTYADEVIESHFYMFNKNPVLLKALAYQYQGQEQYEKAKDFYKKTLELRPNYAQSYMDMANSYRDLGDAQQAAAIYTRYNYLVDEGFMNQDTVGFGPIMEREYNNFLLLKKGAIVQGSKAADLYVAEEEFQGTRLVFEWNDSEAEFDLQFVNPKKQYFTLNHSLADNEAMIANEKDYGYNTTEYLLDGSLPGTWTVNVNYLGNKSLTPTFLKVTIYYNYGSYAQRKETRVFKLSLKEVPHQLFSITTGGKLVSR